MTNCGRRSSHSAPPPVCTRWRLRSALRQIVGYPRHGFGVPKANECPRQKCPVQIVDRARPRRVVEIDRLHSRRNRMSNCPSGSVLARSTRLQARKPAQRRFPMIRQRVSPTCSKMGDVQAGDVATGRAGHTRHTPRDEAPRCRCRNPRSRHCMHRPAASSPAARWRSSTALRRSSTARTGSGCGRRAACA